MQQENEQKKNFVDRTDALARHHKCSMRDLAPIMGVSQGTLFNARGQGRITLSTWSKLEQAEKKAGIANGKEAHQTEPEALPRNYIPAGLERLAHNLVGAMSHGDACASLWLIDTMIGPIREAAEQQKADQQKTVDQMLLEIHQRQNPPKD